MSGLTVAALKAFISTGSARWLAALAGTALCLSLAWCSGNRHGEASGAIHLDDSVAKVSAANTKAIDKLRAADSTTAAGMMAAFTAVRDTAHRAAARADSLVSRLSIVKVGPLTVGHADTSLIASEPDTTKRVGIQRQGDPSVYVVPQFVVDVGTALRDALTKSKADEAQATATIAVKDRLIDDDRNAISSRDQSIAALTDEVKHLKTNAGRDCTIAFIPCPPRKLVALTFTLAGGYAGYRLARR